MKVYRVEKDPPFEPVILELESQKEVNAIYALLNHAGITDLVPILKDSWRKLEEFKTAASYKHHAALSGGLK